MDNEEFSITKEKIPGGVKFRVKGRVNSINAPAIQLKMEEALIDKEKKIILDMYQVKFLSSAGIRVILKTYKDQKNAGGSFGIEQPSENVRNVIGMAALEEMLV